MARNQTLLKLLQDYRAEVRASGNVAHNSNVRDTQVQLLQRHQETLYDEVDWSHLRVERFQNLQAGQRFYDTPDDLSIERLEKIEVRYGDQWEPLFNGVHPEHYSQWDSYRDERSWPVERWQVYEHALMHKRCACTRLLLCQWLLLLHGTRSRLPARTACASCYNVLPLCCWLLPFWQNGCWRGLCALAPSHGCSWRRWAPTHWPSRSGFQTRPGCCAPPNHCCRVTRPGTCLAQPRCC